MRLRVYCQTLRVWVYCYYYCCLCICTNCRLQVYVLVPLGRPGRSYEFPRYNYDPTINTAVPAEVPEEGSRRKLARLGLAKSQLVTLGGSS